MNPDHLVGLLDLLGQQHAYISSLQAENAQLRSQLAAASEAVDSGVELTGRNPT